MVYLNLTQRNSPKCLQIGKNPQTTILEIDAGFSKIKQYGIEQDLHMVEVIY